MSGRELTEWAAYEHLYGPILVQDRVDVGLAQLGLIMARLWGNSKKKLKVRDFMPRWYQDLTADNAVKQGFEQMLKLAEAPSEDTHTTQQRRRAR
jgi:hypothetical protein